MDPQGHRGAAHAQRGSRHAPRSSCARERAARRERLGHVKLTLDAGERSGKLVAELKDVTKRFGDKRIVKDLEHPPDARRPARPHRSERRRQDAR